MGGGEESKQDDDDDEERQKKLTSFFFSTSFFLAFSPLSKKKNRYPSLAKPSWNPPGYVFPLVWVPLKLLQSAALAIVGKAAAAEVDTSSGPVDFLKSATSSKAVGALAVFAGMTALGNYWNVTFFGRRQMKKSVKVMAAFWGSVAATIAAFGAVDKNAGALVAPTIVWVTIATALNATIVRLNPGKGAKED